jgi:hypothetical protein
MKHNLYTITISFVVCDGQRDKVLDEVRALLAHIEKNSLDHASDKKVKVTNEPVAENAHE